MKELEIWFQKNNLIINTEKTFAMSFNLKQLRVPLRPKIVLKIQKFPINQMRSCSIFESQVVQSSLYGKNFKRNNEPIHDKKHIFFKF
jgi:hypothetical protein